jgi:hypothetical protein
MFKDRKKLVKALREKGYEVRERKSGHAQIFTPAGEFVSGLAGSPSEYRGWDNVLARIKRIGGHVYTDGTLTPISD